MNNTQRPPSSGCSTPRHLFAFLLVMAGAITCLHGESPSPSPAKVALEKAAAAASTTPVAGALNNTNTTPPVSASATNQSNSLSAPVVDPSKPGSESVKQEADVEGEMKGFPTTPAIQLPEGVRLDRDVAYLPENRKEKADLYMPTKIAPGTKMPAVIIIHGGGFNDGDKGKKREVNFGSNLAQNGYLGMSINYKLRKSQGQVTWPQSLNDAKTAVRWLRANAKRLNIDPDRIGVIGGSAGGNLAVMLAVTRPQDGLDPAGPYWEYSPSVQCAVDLYGAVDLINYHDMKMFAKTRAEDPDIYHKASPLTYVHKDEPPVLIIHGTDDKVVNVSQSETLAAAMEKVGAPHELLIIPGAPHTFELQSFVDLRPKVIGFFDKYLKQAP